MRLETTTYHKPVLLKESIAALSIKPNGIYVDLTFGGGGHTKAILTKLIDGQVWAFDQDEDAKREAAKIADNRLYFIHGNFRFFGAFLRCYGITKVDGILADLGLSSHQLDSLSRGFAARLGGPLDMRMSQQIDKTAAHILNTYPEDKLAAIFYRYGGIRQPYILAKHLVKARNKIPFTTIEEFRKALAPFVPRRGNYTYYAKVFQALRIEVNDEEGALHEMLTQVPDFLTPTGRLVVITYHEGEDRPVKRFIKYGNLEGRPISDPYGNLIRPLMPLSRKIVRPSSAEMNNKRARSARMRIAMLANPSLPHQRDAVDGP